MFNMHFKSLFLRTIVQRIANHCAFHGLWMEHLSRSFAKTYKKEKHPWKKICRKESL